MAQIIQENGDIITYQGDSLSLTFVGFEPDNNYTVYVQIRNSNNKPIGEQASVQTAGATEVTINVPSSTTDLLTVRSGEEYAEYYYGVKTVLDGVEDTQFINGGEFGTLNKITVYPIKAEGV